MTSAAEGRKRNLTKEHADLSVAHTATHHRAMEPAGQAAASAEPPAAAAADPFDQFVLSSHEPLQKLAREPCPGCSKPRKYYCYDCRLALGDLAAAVKVRVGDAGSHARRRGSKAGG